MERIVIQAVKSTELMMLTMILMVDLIASGRSTCDISDMICGLAGIHPTT